jgi:2-succinyl-5-enolpyruvyl-6-hydroxy-3-cyclohexene-1-carboxylate synthase
VLFRAPNPEPGRVGEAAVRLAAATGFPLLADPLSGARFHAASGGQAVDGYDLFLRDAYVRERLAPDLILRVGSSPTSAALQGWMDHHNGVRHVVVDGGGRWKDHAALATDYVRSDAADTLRVLAGNASRTVDYFAATEQKIVALVMSAIRKIMADFDDTTRVLAVVQSGLSVMRNQKQLTLRLSPEHADTVRERAVQLLERFPGVGMMDIVADSRLKGDAAILESEMGVVEASVELQLKAIEQGFAKLLGSRI